MIAMAKPKIFGKKLPENSRIIIVEDFGENNRRLTVLSNATKVLFEKKLEIKKKGEIHGKPHYIYEVE